MTINYWLADATPAVFPIPRDQRGQARVVFARGRLPRKHSPDDGGDDDFEPLLIGGRWRAEGLAHQSRLDGGDEWFERRRFDETGRLPIVDDGLAESARGADLAGDGQDDQIGALTLIGGAADDHSGALLGGGLIGERKRHQHDCAKGVGGHSRS